MELGFQTWKDIIEVLVVPVSLGLIGLLWPELQSAARHRAFRRLIIRELQELTPFPRNAERGMSWYDHQRLDLIHQMIFDEPSENSDFILSLPPDMVYDVSQLWSVLKSRDSEQWLYFMGKLSDPRYDKNGEIKQAYQQWDSLIKEYAELKSGDNS